MLHFSVSFTTIAPAPSELPVQWKEDVNMVKSLWNRLVVIKASRNTRGKPGGSIIEGAYGVYEVPMPWH